MDKTVSANVTAGIEMDKSKRTDLDNSKQNTKSSKKTSKDTSKDISKKGSKDNPMEGPSKQSSGSSSRSSTPRAHVAASTPPPTPPVPLPAPPLPIPMKTAQDKRMDRLEEFLLVQAQEQIKFKELLMNGLGLEYDDNGDDDEPEDEYPLTQVGRASSDKENAQIPEQVEQNSTQDTEDSVENDTQSWGFCENNALGKPVEDEIAKNMASMLSGRMDEKKLLETMEEYETPENIPALKVPLVNEEIWNSVSPKIRSTDLKAQRVQRFLTKGMTAMVTDLKEPSKMQIDGLACLTAANNELNMLRREVIKTEINNRFLPLCKPSVKVTDFLFGDDLSRQMRDLAAAQKTTSQVVRSATSQKYRGGWRTQPYRGRGGKRNFQMESMKKAFLGLGLPQQALTSLTGRGGKGRGRGRYQRPYQQLVSQQQLIPLQQAQQPQQ